MDILLHLLSAQYLFNRNHGPFTSDLADMFMWFNIALIVGAVLVRFASKNGDRFSKQSSAKFSTFAWTMGLVGIILYGFRQINVLYLSAPILILIWGIISTAWLLMVFNYRFRVVPKRRQKVAQETGKREYL